MTPFFFTKFNGSGRGRFAKIESFTVNENFFPAIANDKPLAGISVENFNIEFPVAETECA